MKNVLFAIIFLLLFSVIFPPVFALVDRIEPWVMGIPFLQFWLLVVSLGIVLCLFFIWLIDEKKEAR